MAFTRTKKSFGLATGLAVLALLAGLLASAATAAVGDNGMVCTDGPSFQLEATHGHIITPDGNSVYMWGYTPLGGIFQNPGPTLCVSEGDTVEIALTNNLSEAVSIAFPGQIGVEADTGGGYAPVEPEYLAGDLTSLTTSVAPGAMITYRFVASEPGTYLYESGTDPTKQIQMGLYGALVVRPGSHPDWAYNDMTTAFDPGTEYLLLMAEIDPDLHRDVELGRPYTPTTTHYRYWTINGRSSPDTIAANGAVWLPNQPYGALVQIEAGAGQSALIRYLNAGHDNHPFHPHGNTMRVVGRDGRPLGAAGQENFTTTIGAGQTYDLLFRWDDVEGFNAAGRPSIPTNSKFPYPNLGNLVFKDDVTWYSGDEYLGVQGDLPPGVTSYNQCGEFYFPWHSHALHEVQNWNEGFGGMLTLVRVDPPGGCP